MTPIFGPKMNPISRLSLAALLALVALALVALIYWSRSPYPGWAHYVPEQPVQFPHALHVGKLKLQCQYCHTSVNNASYAGYPSTHTCMTCHSQVLTKSALLEPVRESYRTGKPITWTRVNSLPDYVYFNHSIHVAKGVGCSTCHGSMTQQTVAQQVQPLTMGWCLSCHRNPAQYLRPQDQVYNQDWRPPPNQMVIGQQLVGQYHIQVSKLDNCSICHH